MLAIVDGGGVLAIVDGGGGGLAIVDGGGGLVVLRLFAASARVHCFLISRATEWPEVQMSQR